MEAVIMAAGLGTRLRPHTEKVPKPLLDVQGRPILDWILAALPPSIDRIVVVVNYLAEQIESYLAQQKHVPNWTTVRATILNSVELSKIRSTSPQSKVESVKAPAIPTQPSTWWR